MDAPVVEMQTRPWGEWGRAEWAIHRPEVSAPTEEPGPLPILSSNAKRSAPTTETAVAGSGRDA
jgi:hypothetical protein